MQDGEPGRAVQYGNRGCVRVLYNLKEFLRIRSKMSALLRLFDEKWSGSNVAECRGFSTVP